MKNDTLNEILKLKYNHRIELEPGVFTCDYNQPHLENVIQLLETIDFQSLACLDIGTRDGGIAFLLEKRGASSVIALDIENRKQFSLVHKYLQVSSKRRFRFVRIHSRQVRQNESLPSRRPAYFARETARESDEDSRVGINSVLYS